MRQSDRQRLINQGLAAIVPLHFASLVFDGFPPVDAAKRASIATPQLRLGGYTKNAPCVFLVALDKIPAGLAIVAKVTCFTTGGERYRIDGMDPEAGTHLRLTTNIADR